MWHRHSCLCWCSQHPTHPSSKFLAIWAGIPQQDDVRVVVSANERNFLAVSRKVKFVDTVRIKCRNLASRVRLQRLNPEIVRAVFANWVRQSEAVSRKL